jgi:hypothetical protein
MGDTQVRPDRLSVSNILSRDCSVYHDHQLALAFCLQGVLQQTLTNICIYVIQEVKYSLFSPFMQRFENEWVELSGEFMALINVLILIRIMRGGVQTGSARQVGHFWPIVPAPGDCEAGEFGGMKIGRGNRSTRRKPTPAPLC